MTTPPMQDDDLQTLRSILAARGRFGHREHLELTWSFLQSRGPEQAYRAVATAIRHVARTHDAADKYHETITRFWVHLIAFHSARSEARSFDQFIDDYPELLDGELLNHHYSRELLSSSQARSRWIEPDLHRLPGGRL